jgi:adenosine deaminase
VAGSLYAALVQAIARGRADLHRHLDGSLRPETLAELAQAAGVVVPAGLGFRPGMGLDQALACFEVTLAVLQDAAALTRVADEIVVDAQGDQVTTLEVRFAPQLHGRRGLGVADAVDAALAGLDRRAGLILCALYGEDPAVAAALVEVARSRSGVVGLDLAGGPAPGHTWDLAAYAPAFRAAAALGLGTTVHAGEGRPPAEIRTAIEVLGARRIGHGTTLLDDPAVVDLVLAREVTIEACLTSNVHVGAIARREDHPLARWLALGVRACVNTDNTLFSAVTLGDELAHAGRLPGMTDELLARAIACGHEAGFQGR